MSVIDLSEALQFEPTLSTFASHGAVGSWGAGLLCELLRKKPHAVLGLPTGGTPIPMYEELVRQHKAGLDFSKASFFNLDEYVGLPIDHPQSYHAYMRRNFFNHVNASPEKIHIPNGFALRNERECQRYERKIKEAGGIDLQVLGIGANGHLGFCEPGTKFETRTHFASLSDQTRKDNARYFDHPDDVPSHAISMGLGTIMEGRHLVLMANGAAKAEAIEGLLKHPISEEMPATILRLHPHVDILVDRYALNSVPAPRASNKVTPSFK